MTQIQRIKNILRGVFTILLSVMMLVFPENGFSIIGVIVFFSFLVSGYKSLRYYFKMSRFMVGGRSSLYRGIIMLDLAAFTLTLRDIPSVYIIMYIMGIHAFSGVVDILRAREAKQLETTSWKSSFLIGAGNLTMAVLVVVFGVFRHSDTAVVVLYSAGLLYAGLLRVISAFKRTAIVYIQ